MKVKCCYFSRFYNHNSSFVHGGLAENGREPEAVYGQQEIHQKIMTLNFRDCHAKIRQVKSDTRSQQFVMKMWI